MVEQYPLAHQHSSQWEPLMQWQRQPPADCGAILFGELAEMWWKDYVDNPKIRLAEPTRLKYRTRLRHHILPRWKDVPVNQMRSKQILDWLHAECNSWYMMIDLRNIVSTIFTKAQEWEVLPDTFANPTRRVKLVRPPTSLFLACLSKESRALFAVLLGFSQILKKFSLFYACLTRA